MTNVPPEVAAGHPSRHGTQLRVNEIFGPTIQGEGPNTGRRCVFLRLAGCNLDCAWCDTPYTWDWTGQNGTVYDKAAESHPMDLADVVDALDAAEIDDGLMFYDPTRADLVVVTGGEPLIQATALHALIRMVSYGVEFQIETNGTRPPLDLMPRVSYVVSPKLRHSGVTKASADKPTAIRALYEAGAVFKFVVKGHTECWEEITDWQDRYGIPAHRIWIMPEGVTTEAVLERGSYIADEAIARGFNLSLRNHVLLWGDERKR